MVLIGKNDMREKLQINVKNLNRFVHFVPISDHRFLSRTRRNETFLWQDFFSVIENIYLLRDAFLNIYLINKNGKIPEVDQLSEESGINSEKNDGVNYNQACLRLGFFGYDRLGLQKNEDTEINNLFVN